MIYLELFLTFFQIGAFTFGGGYAMLPMIQEQVTARGWMNLEDLVNFVAVSESTPGPFAVNISTYVGMETGGILGAFCATLGVVLPSFLVILLVAKFYEKFRNSHVVGGLMSGLRPCVVGLIGTAVLSVGQTVFFPMGFVMNPALLISLAIFALSLVLVLKKIHPIVVIVLAGALGVGAGLLGYL